MSIVETTMKRDFSITVLGRTLEHLGVQMYKRRDTAIAELVANCWDAGAKNVHIHLPKSGAYNQTTSTILIVDDGSGMNPEQIQEQYLVVGRNARRDDSRENPTRPLMGRKGIGKLAGFGLAAEMTVITWQDEIATELTLDVALLKRENGEADRVPIEGIVGELPSFATTPGGTRIVLRKLKHKTPPSIESLRKALSRRFSRRVRGEMIIHVNDEPLGEPLLELENRFPETDYEIAHLEGGGHVRYFYGFAKKPIASGEMRGFTVYVRGKTAQAPPFYFQAEATASGQHATKYMTGEIEADYLDEGTDDESDLISTDRQGIDWESDTLQPFREWGERIVREALREWANRKGDRMEDWISKDAGLNARIQRLDLTSRKQVRKFIRTLGGADAERERALELADSLVRAFEYRHFHDVIRNIEVVGDDPEHLRQLLTHLSEWKVLESRAILEIIKGRHDVIEKFHQMIVNDFPETASKNSKDNMHDLLGGYPWILNPEWQVLSEEKALSTQLREWGEQDIKEEDERLRYDFLALTDERQLVILEIKRPAYPVVLEDLQRLEKYMDRLSLGQTRKIHMVMICGPKPSVAESVLRNWQERQDGQIRHWNDLYERARLYYDHYKAVLQGNVEGADFHRKETEVARTRGVLTPGATHRGPSERAKGLGPQDTNQPNPFLNPPTAPSAGPASPKGGTGSDRVSS